MSAARRSFSRVGAEIGRPGDDDRVCAQGIDQHELRVNEADMPVQGQLQCAGLRYPLVHRITQERAPGLIDVVRGVDSHELGRVVPARPVPLLQQHEDQVARGGVVLQDLLERRGNAEGQRDAGLPPGRVEEFSVGVEQGGVGPGAENRSYTMRYLGQIEGSRRQLPHRGLEHLVLTRQAPGPQLSFGPWSSAASRCCVPSWCSEDPVGRQPWVLPCAR